MRHRISMAVGLVTVLVLLLTACATSTPPATQPAPTEVVKAQTATAVPPTATPKASAAQSRPAVVCVSSEAVTMDPHVNDYGYSREVQIGPYEALLRWEKKPDGSWAPGPNLAKTWEVSEDGLVYTFHLQEGVKFSDGQPFNAEAVKWNLDRLAALGLQPSSKVFRPKDLKVEALGDYTVKVTLPDVYAPFIFQMIQNPMFVSPAAAKAHQKEGNFGDHGDYAQAWLHENAVGTGPYLLQEWRHGESATLVKNADYWRGWEGNHLESVVVKLVGESATRKMMLTGGECDLTWELSSTDLPALQADSNLVIWERPGIDVLTIQMRPRGPFADPRVRKAVALAFDYDAFAKDILQGTAQVANGPLIPVEFGWDSTLPSYRRDVARAKQLMAEAGYANGIEGEQEMWILPNFAWFLRSEAELLQANLAEIGIKIKIVEFGEPAPWLAGVFDPDSQKEPTFFSWTWGGRTGDPDSNLRDMFHSKNKPPAGMNGAFYGNPKVDELLDKGLKEPNPEKRLAIYKELQKILVEEQPFLWLAYPITYFPHNKALQGYALPPLQEWYCTSWYDMWLAGE